ncbi:MAG TPA: hypothetical protein VHZ51_20125 [Ktedonobacteraceae bacterium]|jgi:hypothetical protein|nr:hypothetical protein [Ktedonobacteraceae bacterium]
MVYLHGNNPSTEKCLKQGLVSGKATPFTYTTGCSSSALAIETTDGSYQGHYLCFLGTGFVNLTDYIYIWPFSWNDLADYAGTGCNYGVFYQDINGNGSQEDFNPGHQIFFGSTPGSLPYKSLSSFEIDATITC